MITYVKGSLFESPARVLVNTVNTVGIMGKGIAKEFKQIYPEMFREYQRLCEKKLLTIGRLWLYKTPNKWILNFPTKTTWRRPSRLEYIESGLKAFLREYAKRGISSIAFPPLGCGNGELDWENQVRPLMEKYLQRIPIDVFIHLYAPAAIFPEHKDAKAMADWLRSEPKALGFAEVWHDLTAMIGTGLAVRALTDEQTFKVEAVSSPEGGIRVRVGDEDHFIEQEELVELWSLLRSYGFIMESIMPAGLQSVAQPVITLFSRLPYCRPVEIAADYSNLNQSENVGVQIVPKPIEPAFFGKLPSQVNPV